MSSDLERLLKELAPRPRTSAPTGLIVQRARRTRALHIVVVSLITVAAVGAAIAAAGRFRPIRSDPAMPPAVVRQTAEVKVDDHPVAVASGEGAIWTVTWEGTLQRIDPATNEVTGTVQLLERDEGGKGGLSGEEGEDLGPAPAPEPGRPFGTLTVGEGAVWVTASEGRGCRLFKIHPPSLEIAAQTAIDGCYPFTAGAGAVWAGISDDSEGTNRVIKLDPATIEEVGSVDVGPCCMSGIAVAADDVWVGRQDVASVVREQDAEGGPLLDMELDVLRIDPDEMRVIDEVDLPGNTYRPGDTLLSNTIASDDSGVWLTRPEAGFLERVDEATNEISLSVAVQQLRMPDTPLVGNGWVAVLDLNGSKLAVLSSDTGEVADVFDTRSVTTASAGVVGDSIWIAHPERDRLVRLDVDI
jgi:DNA-binding beta-propeller fold protein YncE